MAFWAEIVWRIIAAKLPHTYPAMLSHFKRDLITSLSMIFKFKITEVKCNFMDQLDFIRACYITLVSHLIKYISQYLLAMPVA